MRKVFSIFLVLSLIAWTLTFNPVMIQRVSAAPSSTSVICTPNLISIYSYTNCTATVFGTNVTGNVTWSTSSVGGTFSQTICPLVSGSCMVRYQDNFSGCVTISAFYSGDANNNPSFGSFILTVTSGGPVYYSRDFASVQAAVNAAPEGATVIVASGFYSGSLIVAKTLTIIGEKDPPVFGGGGSPYYLFLSSGASGSIVTGFEITNYIQGIIIQDASSCGIYSNMMCSITDSGIVLQGSGAQSNRIFCNIFQDTLTPINLTASATYNNIWGNMISSEATVTLNIGANGNSFYDNIMQGSQIIVDVTDGANNLIYNNNFVATSQITVLTAGGNYWNTSYPTGGNYWSDYQSKYPGAVEIDNSGIWNTPYVIDSNNIDGYPLMNPWAPAPGHDIAVTTVVTSKTVVGQGYTASFSIGLCNKGQFSETFSLAAYANTTVIFAPIVNDLGSASQATLIFQWGTIGFVIGNYTISVWAWPVPSETGISDNNFILGVIKVSIPGDVNGDFKVQLADLVFLANAYGTRANIDPQGTGLHQWNPNADIDNNGAVNLADLVILAIHYGQHYP